MAFLETLEGRASLTLMSPVLVAANLFLTPDSVSTVKPWTPEPDLPPIPLGPAGPGAALDLQQKFDIAISLSTPPAAYSTQQLD